MIRISKFALCSFIVGALALSGRVVQAQATDDPLVKRGLSLYKSRSCSGCHTIGRGQGFTLQGPDLGGVTERRSQDWLKRWLKDPNAMIGSDSLVDQLVATARNVKMPNLHLNDQDITALLAYLKVGKW